MKDELSWKAVLIIFLHEMIVRIDEIIVLWSCLAAGFCEAAGFYGTDFNYYIDGHITGVHSVGCS